MDIVPILERLGVALGLGLLVGVQRQRTDAHLAGFRTFPLVTVFGSFARCLARRAAAGSSGSGCLHSQS